MMIDMFHMVRTNVRARLCNKRPLKALPVNLSEYVFFSAEKQNKVF